MTEELQAFIREQIAYHEHMAGVYDKGTPASSMAEDAWLGTAHRDEARRLRGMLP